MRAAASLTLQLALHDDAPHRSILVSRDGIAGECVSLPKGEIVWRALPGRMVRTTKGLKLQIVEVTLPEWLARDRGLT